MKKIFLLITITTLIFIQTIFAASIVSDNYSTSSYNTGLIAYSDDNLTNTLGYQQIGKSGENANYSLNLGIFQKVTTVYCGNSVCDSEETCSTCSNDCGACPIEAPSTDGGGGGGGGIGTTACTYNWVCSDWYPQTCPSNEIQERFCVNKGTCEDTQEMPEIEQNCEFIQTEISPKEPLFDLFVNIPLKYKLRVAGENLEIEIELINKGNTTPLDVFFTYWVADKNNKLIIETKETRAISAQDKFTIIQNLPGNIKPGLHKFYAHISYDTDDKIAIAEETFYVTKSKNKLIWTTIFLINLLIIIILTIIIIKLVKKSKKKHKKTKKQKTKFVKKSTNKITNLFKTIFLTIPHTIYSLIKKIILKIIGIIISILKFIFLITPFIIYTKIKQILKFIFIKTPSTIYSLIKNIMKKL